MEGECLFAQPAIAKEIRNYEFGSVLSYEISHQSGTGQQRCTALESCALEVAATQLMAQREAPCHLPDQKFFLQFREYGVHSRARCSQLL